MAGSGTTEDDLEREHPWVAWRRPVRITLMGVEGACWGCRYCIAMFGQRGQDVADGMQSLDEFADHVRLVHGREPEL